MTEKSLLVTWQQLMSKITVNLTVELEANGKPVNKAELQRVFDYILAPRDDGIKLNCGEYDFESVEVTSAHMNLPPEVTKEYKVGDIVTGRYLPEVPVGSIISGQFNTGITCNIAIVIPNGIHRQHFTAPTTFDRLLDYYQWTLLYVNN